MRNLFSRRFTAIWAVFALLLIAGVPGASGAEAEAPSESGWVEQEAGTGGADGGSSEAEQGSSLGSGGGSVPAPEPEPEPVESSPPPKPEPTTPEPSSEEEPSTTSSEDEEAEEAASAEEEVAAAPVVEKPEPKPLAGGTALVGSAVLGVSAEANLAPLVSSPTNFGDAEGGSSFGSTGVAFLALVVLVFAAVGGWFGLRRWRHSHRLRREAAEWKAAVRRLGPDPH
jgi:hypothetical protein